MFAGYAGGENYLVPSQVEQSNMKVRRAIDESGEEELKTQCDTDGKEANDEDDECRQAAR